MVIAGAPLGGAAAHWGAIGALAAAALPPTDPKDVKIRELSAALQAAEDKIRLAEGRLKTREDSLDRANAVVDDQAAQIVDLQGKLGLARGGAGGPAVDLAKLARIEDNLRAAVERLEARVAQLVANWPADAAMPSEPAYFRRNGTDL